MNENKNWFQELFIDEAKTVLDAHSANSDSSQVKRELEENGQIGRTGIENVPAITAVIPGGSRYLNGLGTVVPENIVIGAKYIVTIGEEVREAISYAGMDGEFRLGNYYLCEDWLEDTGEDFSVAIARPDYAGAGNNHVCLRNAFNDAVTVSVDIVKEITHPIDPKFLPDTVATKADILGAMEASY